MLPPIIYRIPLGRIATLPALFIAMLAAIAIAAFAQAPPVQFDNTGGTEYLIAFPDTTANRAGGNFPDTRVTYAAQLMIFSAVGGSVEMELNGSTRTYQLVAGGFRVIDVTTQPIQVRGSNTATAQGVIHLKAASPIIVYCYLAGPQGIEAWTPLPVDAWGKRYFAAAYPGEVLRDVTKVNASDIQSLPKAAPAEILVIAAHDRTRVSIAPPGGVGFAGNPAYTVTLRARQAYLVQSVVNASDTAKYQQDIAGTIVTADKPIGVMSGNTRSSGQDRLDEEGVLSNAYKNLLLEWLTPVEMHGRDFVFMPTWDNHRAGVGAAAERKREYVRAYNTSGKNMAGYYLQQGGTTLIPLQVRADTLQHIMFVAPVATVVHTAEPSQVVMNSMAIVHRDASSPCGGIECVTYSAWGAYMVDLAPRERWTSFAPYYAPVNPGNMQHYINVVTDTVSMRKIFMENGSPFLFNRAIAGTNLIWGSMAVTPGVDHWLAGKDGAKFWGFAYGLLGGGEEWRPSVYEEYTGVSYGYPLVSSINIPGARDSARIDTALLCNGGMTIAINIFNANPAGLRSIALDTGAVNTRLVWETPRDPATVSGRATALVRVEPVNLAKPASARVIVKGRGGESWTISYAYLPQILESQPGFTVDFRETTVNVESERRVTYYNRTANPVAVGSVSLTLGNQGYSIGSTIPSGPAEQPARAVTLAPGDSMIVVVKLRPAVVADSFIDTLLVNGGCIIRPVALEAEYGVPAIYLGDLSFGVYRIGDPPKTLHLTICNLGQGLLAFENPAGGDVVTWSGSSFTVDAASLARLKSASLVHNQCDSLLVTFTPRAVGNWRTIARVWSNVTNLRDSSEWTATVIDTALSVPGSRELGNDLQVQAAAGVALIRYTLAARSAVRVEIFDGLGRQVTSLADGSAEAGTHALLWDGEGHPGGVYYCRMTVGNWSRTAPVVLSR